MHEHNTKERESCVHRRILTMALAMAEAERIERNMISEKRGGVERRRMDRMHFQGDHNNNSVNRTVVYESYVHTASERSWAPLKLLCT
jgi:hypothetical protein